MSTRFHTDVDRRHDFVILFDVRDGNPNGDPDAGNQPRVDPETMQGLVTDVALKRRVRDYVEAAGENESRNKIYVQRETYLAETRRRVFEEHSDEERADGEKAPHPQEARKWMCEQFYDVRMFGAVMGMTQHNAGQVRGPVQLTFSRSIDPVFIMDSAIAQAALESGGKFQAEGRESSASAPAHGTMGRKSTVPYGLYLGYGFFNPHFARRTGADSRDLEMFWEALTRMWDLDRSSSRGLTACRGLYVFSHESPLGNAPAHQLFERVEVHRRAGVETPRRFADYAVSVDADLLPDGVSLTRLEG